jgi:hypothetical protein
MNKLFVCKTLQEKENESVIQGSPPQCVKVKTSVLIEEVLDMCHLSML